MSLQELGARSRTPTQTVARHETIDGQMTLAQMLLYAAALGIPAELILPASSTLTADQRTLLKLTQDMPPKLLTVLINVARAIRNCDTA